MPVQEQRHIKRQHRIVHLPHKFSNLLQLLRIPLQRVQKVQLIKILQLLISQLIRLINPLFQRLLPEKPPILGSVDLVTNLECKLEVSRLDGERKLFLRVLDHVESD